MAKPKKSKPPKPEPTDTTPAKIKPENAEKDKEKPQPPSQTASTPSEPLDFESYYLQQVTTEFADDLDKIRSASDFGEKSLSVLVAALKEGVSIYSEEERKKVIGTGVL